MGIFGALLQAGLDVITHVRKQPQPAASAWDRDGITLCWGGRGKVKAKRPLWNGRFHF